MISTTRGSIIVTLVLVTAMSVPDRAEAQFGSIRNRIQKQIEKKVEGDKAPSRSGRAPVTDEYVAKLLKGFDAEAKTADDLAKQSLQENAQVIAAIDDYLKRERAYEAAKAASDKRAADYNACVNPHAQEMMAAAQNQPASVQNAGMAMAQRMESMSPAERKEFEQKMDKLEKEAKAAEKSGNVAEQERIRGEVAKLTGMPMDVSAADQQKLAANSARAQKAAKGYESCGPMPQASRVAQPAPVKVKPIIQRNGELVLGPAATQEIRDSTEAHVYIQNLRVMRFGNQPAVAGAAASGMDTGDYSLGREQVLYFFALPALRGESDGRCPPAFHGDECAVLQRHRDEILAAAKRLRDSGAFTL